MERLARLAGVHPSQPQVRRLWTGSLGWPLVVDWAIQWLASVQGDVAAADLGEGAQRFTQLYLRTEVVDALPDPLRRFAMVTSVMNGFTVALADKLVGGHDSASTIEELERHGVPIVARSEGGEQVFSYPAVLARCLRDALRAAEPWHDVEVLRQGAWWHLRRDEPVQAIDALLRAGDLDAAVWEILAHGPDLFVSRPAVDAASWARAMVRPVRRSRPLVTLLLAALCQRVGDVHVADALLGDLEEDAAGDAEMRHWGDVVRCLGVLHHRPADVVLATARRLLSVSWESSDTTVSGPDSGLDDSVRARWRVRLSRTMPSALSASGARALIGLGQLEEARLWCDKALGDPNVPPNLRMVLLGVLARAEAAGGYLAAARRHATQALAFPRELVGADDAERAEAHLALGIVALEQVKIGPAETHLAEAERRARSDRRTSLLGEVVLQRARAALLSQRPSDGLAALESFNAAGHPEPSPAIAARMRAVEAQLWLAEGDPVRARQALAGTLCETVDVVAARAQVAFVLGSHPELRSALEAWAGAPGSDDPRSAASRLLWSACAAQQVGERVLADRLLADAVRLAEAEELRAVFHEAGQTIGHLLGSMPSGSGVAMLLGDAPVRPAPGVAQVEMSTSLRAVDPLSKRELVVISHLGRALDERELAAELYISLNTLKTHLKHVYRKLGVGSRLQAVLRARELGIFVEPVRSREPSVLPPYEGSDVGIAGLGGP